MRERGNWNSYEWFELNLKLLLIEWLFWFSFHSFSFHPLLSCLNGKYGELWKSRNLSYIKSQVAFIGWGCYRSFFCSEESNGERGCDGLLSLWVYDDSRNWMWNRFERRIRVNRERDETSRIIGHKLQIRWKWHRTISTTSSVFE